MFLHKDQMPICLNCRNIYDSVLLTGKHLALIFIGGECALRGLTQEKSHTPSAESAEITKIIAVELKKSCFDKIRNLIC